MRRTPPSLSRSAGWPKHCTCMAIRANIVSAKVQVASGYLGDDSDRHETIQLIGATSASQRWGALGNRRREEEYTLAGVVYVLEAGKSEPAIKDVRDRAFELLAEIEDFLRLDPTIGNTVKVAGS